MNTYLIPREMKDENRFLIFSKESLIFFLVGVLFGAIAYSPFYLIYALNPKLGAVKVIGIIIWVVITIIAWALGTFDLPETNAFEFLKKAGGEKLFDIIKRVINFKKNRKIYY